MTKTLTAILLIARPRLPCRGRAQTPTRPS
jgi:hypothetical protein